MKNVITMLVILLMSVTLMSCMGEKGADGDVYLKYSWNSSNLESYGDNTGLSYISASYQHVNAGTYYFDYYCWGGSTLYNVYGNFTLVANEGKPGGVLWEKGADGYNRNYTLTLGSTRASLSKSSAVIANVKNSSINKFKEFDLSLPILTRTETIDGGTIIYKYQEKIVRQR